MTTVYVNSTTAGSTWDTSATTTQCNSTDTDYNYIPTEVEGVVEWIMGKPAKAKFLISSAYKKKKDPIIFIQNKKSLMKELIKLLQDERVDKRTILISEIKRQWKPTKKLLEKAEK